MAIVLNLAGFGVAESRAKAVALLEYLEVGQRKRAFPARLSGGEAQRVAIARALANRPRIILADEPTAALDSQRAEIVMDLLRKVAVEQKAAVLAVTHDEKIFDRFDYIFRLRDGWLPNKFDLKRSQTMPRSHTGKPTFAPIIITGIIALVGLGLVGVNQPLSPKLTPKLQELLRKEMLSIDEASQKILVALVAGDDAVVATLAQQIHDSFILRQSMTPEDKAHLMAVAPQDFIQMDRDFHEISAMLAQAARTGNRPLQREQFGRMVEACSGCHAQYANDRFPGFTK